MKIVLATDFSEENNMLYPYAIDLLKDAGGEIIIFHSYMDPFFVGNSGYPGSIDTDTFFNRDVIVEMENRANQSMQAKTELINQTIQKENIENIKVRSFLKGGNPETELISIAKSENPDLILMGTRGKGKKDFLEGSLAKSIMTKINVPMLSIPEGYHWRKSTDVLYATNFGKYEVLTINRIFSILKPYHPTIHVLHLLVDQDAKKASTLMSELEQAFQNQEISGVIRFDLVRTSDAREALKVFCEQQNISMASFIAHRRSLMDYIFRDKVEKEDFFNLKIPMLSFREP